MLSPGMTFGARRTDRFLLSAHLDLASYSLVCVLIGDVACDAPSADRSALAPMSSVFRMWTRKRARRNVPLSQ